jgi:predicted nucleic acid-binding protein
MADVCVVNASPLIFLARGGHIGLLHAFARHVYVPNAVAEEIRRRGAADAAVRAIDTHAWIQVSECPRIPPAIMLWGL